MGVLCFGSHIVGARVSDIDIHQLPSKSLDARHQGCPQRLLLSPTSRCVLRHAVRTHLVMSGSWSKLGVCLQKTRRQDGSLANQEGTSRSLISEERNTYKGTRKEKRSRETLPGRQPQSQRDLPNRVGRCCSGGKRQASWTDCGPTRVHRKVSCG